MTSKQLSNNLPETSLLTSRSTIILHNREYNVACAPGEEERLNQLAALVDEKITFLAKKNPIASESHLFMLTCLLLADELTEARKIAAEATENLSTSSDQEEEDLLVSAVDHLCARVTELAHSMRSE